VGARVIGRAHAKARSKDALLGPLTEVDYLACVDDFSRVGALRLRDESGHYLRSVADGARSTPAFLELEKILLASRAVEVSQETAEDLGLPSGQRNIPGRHAPQMHHPGFRWGFVAWQVSKRER
jgi:serine/threonine-protein kinase HipA